MHLYGKVIVIKRNGTDGAHFPLTAKCCVFGRGLDSDIRIQLPTVDSSQCQILIDDKEHVFIQSISTTSTTLINDKPLSEALTALSHGDIITIVDRKFRFEFPVDSRFYPHKSPKSKSPRTPKRASMTRLSAGGVKDSSFSRHLAPVTPLSPRTDNVPPSVKSPRSASKVSDQLIPAAHGDQFSSPKTGRQSYGSAKKGSSSEVLFSLSPAAFYSTSMTPDSSKNFSDPQEGSMKAGLDMSSNIPSEGQVDQAFPKSPSAVRQRSPGSPYSKTSANLRKSISELRRRSVPVFETEEGSTQVQKKSQQGFVTPSVQIGSKRKSTAYDLLSAKRKRVSFGPNLSPEHFDKTLPPRTPIKKGATPSRIIRPERKSLLKTKSPGRKSMSPHAKSPAKKASTPPSSQVFEVSVNAATFSPMVASPNGVHLQSPKSGLHNSESRRSSPRGGSENEIVSVSSPGRKLSPANKRNSQGSVKLNENDTSVLEFSDQEILHSNAVTSSSSVLSPITKSVRLGKDDSPLSTGNSSFASSKKSATPRTPKRTSFSYKTARSSFLLQNSTTSRRSDSSFRKSVTPRKSISPQEKSTTSDRASLSPKNTLLNASDSEVLPTPINRKYAKTPVTTNTSLIETANTSARTRKLSISPLLSQDLFSQVSPKTAEGTTVSQKRTSLKTKRTKSHSIIGVASPVGIKRIFKTPRQKQTADISPSAIRRLMKTPKVKQIKTSPGSPIGVRNLIKTPRNRKSNEVVVTPSGLKQLLKTPVKPVSEASLIGVNEVMKSQRTESSDVSFSGVSSLFSTPEMSAQAAASLSWNSGSTSVTKKFAAAVNTPGSPLSRMYSQSPKKVLETSVSISSTEKKRSVGRPSSGKKHPVENSPSVELPVGRPPSEKRPVGRPPSVKKHPVENSPSVGRSPSVKRPVGRPPSVERPVGQPPSEKRPVGRPQSVKKHPIENSPSVERPVGQPPSEKRPVGRPPSVKKRPVENSPSVGHPPSEKRPVGRPPSEKRPVGRPLSEKRPVGRPPSANKTPPGLKNSPAEKIISPPQDFKKVVALRAIHGHGLTPRRTSFKVLTPASIKRPASTLFRKTPAKKTWSDIVKSGVQKTAPVKKTELTTIKAVTKRISPKPNKQVHKTPKKTPRALARALAPTTGHADSPATIIVGRKFKGTRTPKLLPRKGRKGSLSKASRKSVGNTSFTGLAEMFTEPVVSENSLYADIPDTPDGPNEMFVSPLSSRKSSLGARKSTNLTGVRELFLRKQIQETNLIGVKELFISPGAANTVSPSGLSRLMKTPKKRANDVSPTGVKRLLATPKVKSVPVSPFAIDSLFRTPTLSDNAVPEDGKSALKQASRSGETEILVVSAKSGQRGRKQKAEEHFATPSSNKLSPTRLTADLSPRSSHKEHHEEPLTNTAASARKLSPNKSPPPSGKRQSGVQKTPAAERMGSPATASFVGAAAEIMEAVPLVPDKSADRGETQSKEHTVDIVEKQTLLSPKLSVRGRRGKAAVKETSTSAQSPPKAGARGRRGQTQIKEYAVNETVKIAVDNKHILSPKIGARGRRGKAEVKETSVLAADAIHAQSPPKVGARGRRGKAEVKESSVLAVDAIHAQSPPKVGARGRRGQTQIREPAVLETVKIAADDKHILSPRKVGPRGRQGKAPVKGSTETGEGAILAVNEESTSSSVRSAGRRKGSKETVQAQENAKLAVAETTESIPKGRRGRGQTKESVHVQIDVTLTVDNNARQSKTTVVKSAAADDASIAVIQKISPKVATRGRRGQSKITESASVETSTDTLNGKTASPSKTATRGRFAKVESASVEEISLLPPKRKKSQESTKTTTNSRQGEAEIVKSSIDNTSSAAKRGGKRNKTDSLEVVPLVNQRNATSSPKRRAGRRKNETPPVTQSVVAETSNTRGARSTSVEPASSVSGGDVSQERKQIGGVKRKAGKTSSVPLKKVKVDSPVHVSPAKPRTTRKGKSAKAKSPNINVVSSPKGRGRPKNVAEVKGAAPVLTSTASLIPEGSPKGRKGQLKKGVAIVASPSAEKRGRSKKNAGVTVVASVQDSTISVPKTSPPKGRQGRLKKATAVKTIASPATKKRGGPKAGKPEALSSLVVSDTNKRKRKPAAAISNAKVLPKSPVATRRRRL